MKRESADDVPSDEGNPDIQHGTISTLLQKAATKVQTDTFAEWDTAETINAVKAAIEERHNVWMVEADATAYKKFQELRPDIVFNIAEGMYGPSREAQIPAMLELLGIPYTGSDPLTLGICLDKSRAKEILSYYNIPTPKFVVAFSAADLLYKTIELPCIVKPLHEGSSKGVLDNSVVRTLNELRGRVEQVVCTYEQPALVEEYLEGREFTVAILGNSPNIQVLPIIEIKFDSLPEGVNPIYSYEAKWIWDQVEHPVDVHECPAQVSSELKASIVDVSKKAYTVLRCRDWCRIDIRLNSKGVPNIIELNPLPGILPDPEEHSCFPFAARTAGISYNSLINKVLDEAIKRYRLL